MEIPDLVNLLLNSGTTIVVMAFFMYRDIKFSSQLQTTLVTLVDTVESLKNIVQEKREEK